MKGKSPAWWKAWQRIVPRLIKSGRAHRLDPHLKGVLEDISGLGLDCQTLLDWLPNDVQTVALQQAQVELGKLLNPFFRTPDRAFHRVRRLLGSAGVPDVLMKAFEANVARREPASRKGNGSGKATTATSKSPAKAARTRPKPTEKMTRSRAAQQRLERARLEMPSVTDWGRDCQDFLICIDETWPHTGKRGSEGVIAGVVWQGAEPDFSVLPAAKDHRYASLEAYEILEQLFRCPRALPFIMPIRLDDRRGQASQHYDDLLQAAIQIVLGWLLPVDGVPAQLRIWMDHDSRHPHGFDQTDFYQGLLRGTQRFARYDIQEVAWYDLDRIDSYIAYADQLAYLARESTKSNRELGQIAKFKQLPGYVPLTMDLVQRLKRLEHLEENGDVETFMDLAVELRQTRMGELLVEDVRRRLVERRDLQLRLLETLDRRYQHRSRDLRKLEKAVDVVRRIVSITPEQQGIRARLLSTAVQFQSANFDGDPHRVTALIEEYETIREQALEDVPDLAVECDLHLAGVWAEQLEFDQAVVIAEDWADDIRFPFLPRFLRAKVLTSLGRYQAAVENFEEAENQLQRAVELMEAAELALPSLVGWREIPASYRAHNAIDAGAETWYELLVDAVGDPAKLVEELASNQQAKQNRYRHRLLLRAMAASGRQPPLAELTKRYLDRREDWAMHEGEPWPDIALYRAYVLWQAKEPQDASRWFDRALLALASRRCGATLQLFSACIGTIAYSCFDDQHFRVAAEQALATAEPRLPAATAIIQSLKTAIERPDAGRVPQLMALLKFHYL